MFFFLPLTDDSIRKLKLHVNGSKYTVQRNLSNL